MNKIKKTQASNLLEYKAETFTFRILNYNYDKKASGMAEIFVDNTENENGFDYFLIPLEDLQYILTDINKINEEVEK